MGKPISEPKLDRRNSFKGGSGKEYFIEVPEILGIERRRAFDGLLSTAAFGVGTKGLISGFLKIKDAFNKMQLTEVGHLITTQLNTASNIHSRSDAVLNICTLFINEKDEDRTKVPTDAEMEEKITDWNAAGIPYSFFDSCARTFNDTLRALLEASSPSSPGAAKASKRAAASSTTST